ncbi:hypothetical protein HO663_04875 [Streptococcus suis]|nr:hypothetical protein [Streptococcus suis]HEM3206306.1 hypothetical protein [Streptococcus suis 4417]MBY5027293.1 hypothetical protein [Streptococcus suis]MBY6287593.1 hypothetical protein [Streptococcus suis]MBY6294760.1 hypothetical protein [Streptococcus suis]
MLEETTQPCDLATALQYMKDHGEFIRCKSANQDFYMYRDVQRRPGIVNGRRKFVDVETIWAFNQWGGTAATINIADMLNEEYWIMKFDENGNPD